MADIDVGSAAINRNTSLNATDTTMIDANNAANASGHVTEVEIWAATYLSGVRIGIFYLVSGSTYKCRDSTTIGDVAAGSKRTFTVQLNVQTGDFIGFYTTSGNIEATSDVGGTLWVAGEHIDVDDQAVYAPAVIGDATISLYGFRIEETITGTSSLAGLGALSLFVSGMIPGSAAIIGAGTLLTFGAKKCDRICWIAFASDPYDAIPVWTDVSKDLRAFSIRKGRQHALDRIEAAVAVLTLDNSHYNYYPNNANGDYYPNVLPGKRLCIMVAYDTVYRIFTGYITDYTPDWSGQSGLGAFVKIEAVGLLGNLARLLLNDGTGYSAELSGTRVDNVLNALSTNIGRDLAAGQTTLQASGALANENALSHLQVVQQSELGYVFEAGDGDIQYHDRHTRQSSPYTTSQAIFSDIPGFSNLVLYLPLWHSNLEPSPFTSRDSYGHTCTVTGATWGSTGRTFDGNDVISVAHNAVFNITTALTIEAWIKLTDVLAYRYIASKDTTGSGYNVPFDFRVDITTGTLFGRIGDGAAALNSINGGTNLNDALYHHVVFEYDTSYLYLFKDGASDATPVSKTITPTTNSIDISIGYWQGLWMIGAIGEIRIYNRALTAQEIKESYSANLWRFS